MKLIINFLMSLCLFIALSANCSYAGDPLYEVESLVGSAGAAEKDVYVDSWGQGKIWLRVKKYQDGRLTFSIIPYPRARYLWVYVERNSPFVELRYQVKINDIRGREPNVEKSVTASTAAGLAELFLDLWFERMPIGEVDDFSNFMRLIK